MAINSASGSIVSIGTTKAATIASEFAADTYVEVGSVESMGEFGDESSTVTFTAIRDARVSKRKGAKDAGMVALVVGKDPVDVGQIALKAAQKTKFVYNLKIELADKATTGGTNTIFYLRVLVMSTRDNVGNNDNIVRTTYNCAITEAPLEILGT